MSTTDDFPQPQRKDGGEPCAECHIQHGETCDICGAVGPGPHAASPSPSPDLVERLAVGSDLVTTGEVIAKLSRLQAVEERYLKLVDLYSMAETEADRLRAELDEARDAHHRRGSRIAALEAALETQLVEGTRIDSLRDEWRLAANNWQTRAESAEAALASMRSALTEARKYCFLGARSSDIRRAVAAVDAALKEGTP